MHCIHIHPIDRQRVQAGYSGSFAVHPCLQMTGLAAVKSRITGDVAHKPRLRLHQ